MSELTRFGVSLGKNLIAKFDKDIKKKNYPTRSKAIGDLIRDSLIKREWIEGKEVVGAVMLVYNHHRRELETRLTDTQHDFRDLIISSQHIHLDHNNCLEVIVVKGMSKDVEKLARVLKTAKGVKHGSLTMTTTGKHLA